MTVGVHFCTIGLTLMSWEGPWDRHGAPEGTLGATLAHLHRKTPKTTKKTTFWWLVLKSRFNDISRLFLSLLLHVLQAWQMMPKCLQKITKGVPKLHIVDGNAQIEKLRFDCAGASGSRVRHARKHVKANKNGTQTNTRRIHHFFVKSDTKDCQNGHRFSQHFTMISSVIFKRQKKQKIVLGSESRWGHLGHI